MITHVKFVSIPVKDQDQALDFYTKKLGFKVLKDEPFGEGKRWIELGIPGAQTFIVLFTAPGQEDRIGSFSTVDFATDDVEKTYPELKELGVQFTVPPTKQPWGMYAIFVDQDGNQFVLSSSG